MEGRHAKTARHLAPRTRSYSWTDIKRALADMLLWCLLAILLASGFLSAERLSGGGEFSLRFDKPVSGDTAYKARQYAIEQGDGETFWPTFWSEESRVFSSEHADTVADCIVYSGDAALLWRAELISGAFPGVSDDKGCAVSSALAWRLWGSVDLVGREVESGEEKLIIRGVFESGRELALVSRGDGALSQSWSAAELSGGKEWATRKDAASFAASSGLGSPDAVLSRSGSVFAAMAMTALPIIILSLYALALFWGLLRKQPPFVKALVPFVLLLGFALVLPVLLDRLPQWLIPTRWSDFSSWSALFGAIGEGIEDYLSAVPRIRDVDERLLLLKQICVSLAASLCAVTICFRWAYTRKTGGGDAL